ncbi:hypothetical protein LINGRAHAP2_LOCUS22980 [Linum grandiflorum]
MSTMCGKLSAVIVENW